LEDIPDTRQTTAECMISDVNEDQITSMWAVSVGNKCVEKHFVILLANGSHHCSCLSLINQGIICRYYFQIMLHSPTAKFHLRLIPSRWYYRDKDPSKEPFLVASKFETETTPITPQYNVPFLSAICQTIPQDNITQHERLTDIQLYGKIAGLTHKATMKAIKKKDVRIVYLLEDYLKDEEDEEQNIDDTELLEEDIGSDKENCPIILSNPHRQTKPKGRPKGTKRIKAHHETESFSTKYKCGRCGNMGHNRRNCNV